MKLKKSMCVLVTEENGKKVQGGMQACLIHLNKKRQLQDLIYRNTTHKTIICYHCQCMFGCASLAGTSNLKNHRLSCKFYLVWNQRKAPGAITINNEWWMKKVYEGVCRDATNGLLVLVELQISFSESICWRHFCSRVNLYKPHSRRTAIRDIVQMYENEGGFEGVV